MKNLLKNTNGQSLVEFALVLPLLILLIMGIMEMGRLFEGYLELENAARDAARYASINSTQFTDTTANTWGNDNLPTRLASDLVMIESADVSIFLEKPAANDFVRITLTYDLPLMTPLIGDLIENGPTPNTFRLTSKIAMRGE
jgi:Flp pilus assembly protein TadG